MKTIKSSLITLLLVTVLVSCLDFRANQKGELYLENGENKEVPVKYEILESQYNSFVTQVKTKTELQAIAERASLETKYMCKFKLTYEPTSLSFNINHDTITVFVYFNAKNAFGVPDTETSISKFKGTSLIETY